MLLEAGLVEFGLHGFRGTSTARIAARAGVPQPHVYVSFPSKAALFIACAEFCLDTLRCDPGLQGARVLDPSTSRFLLQAAVSLQDPELSDDLPDIVAEIRAQVTPEVFESRLLAALRAGLDGLEQRPGPLAPES